jgi:hypothetical protein
VWTPVRRRNSRAPMQRTVAESGVTSSSTSIPLDSRGPMPPWSPGNQWSQFPSRREERGRDGQLVCEGVPGSTDRLFLPRRADSGSPEDPAAMDTGAAGLPIDQTRKTWDEPVTFLHVNCPNFSDAARKEPKAAWRHLLLALSPEGSPLRPLDILPMSATTVLQQYLITNTPPLSEKNFRRRAAAYRNSYYRAYRQATLQGFPKFLQSELLVHIQTDAYTVPPPPPTKYPDILRIHGRLQGSPSGLPHGGLGNTLVQPLPGSATESVAGGSAGGFRGVDAPRPALSGDLAPEVLAPPTAPPDTRLLLRGPPPPLPPTGIGFNCPSRRCRDKLPYATAAGYIQHLNQQHKLEEAHSLRLPNRLPDIVKCRDCNHFCQNARGFLAHERGLMHAGGSVIPSAGGPSPLTPSFQTL